MILILQKLHIASPSSPNSLEESTESITSFLELLMLKRASVYPLVIWQSFLMTYLGERKWIFKKSALVGDMLVPRRMQVFGVLKYFSQLVFPVSFQITNWWTSVWNTKIIHLMTPIRMYISWRKHGSLRMINSCHQHTCVHFYHVYINIKAYHVYIHTKAYACIDLRLRTHECVYIYTFNGVCTYMYIRTHINQHLAGQSVLKIPGASTRETRGNNSNASSKCWTYWR